MFYSSLLSIGWNFMSSPSRKAEKNSSVFTWLIVIIILTCLQCFKQIEEAPESWFAGLFQVFLFFVGHRISFISRNKALIFVAFVLAHRSVIPDDHGEEKGVEGMESDGEGEWRGS